MALMRRIAGLLAAAALGCGSGTSSQGNSFDGTVHGQPMKPSDAISATARVALASLSANVLSIVLTDSAGVCAKVSANTEPRNGKALIILLADFNAFVITPPSGTGTFTVYDPGSGGLPPAHGPRRPCAGSRRSLARYRAGGAMDWHSCSAGCSRGRCRRLISLR